jgi:hypothetical protein
MKELISPCQSAFIKGRSIHDNFLYVKNIVRRLKKHPRQLLYVKNIVQCFHCNGTPSLLIKLDISKTFDYVLWDYLLALM